MYVDMYIDMYIDIYVDMYMDMLTLTRTPGMDIDIELRKAN